VGRQCDVETIREHSAVGSVNGLRVKLLMELVGCSHTELAERTGLSRQTISQLCGATPKQPSIDTRERIAAGLRECLTPERVL